MRCSKCNAENNANSKFCIICGEMLENKKDVNPDFDGRCKICKENIKDTKHQEYLLGVIGEVLCARCAETIYRINNTKDYDEYAEKTDYAMSIINSDFVDEDCKAILLGEINWNRFSSKVESETDNSWEKNPVEEMGHEIRDGINNIMSSPFIGSAKQAAQKAKEKIEQKDLSGEIANLASKVNGDQLKDYLATVSGKSGWYRIVKVIGYLTLLVSTIGGGVLGYVNGFWGRDPITNNINNHQIEGMILGALAGIIVGCVILSVIMMFAEMASNISTTVDLLSSINEKLDKQEKEE